MAVLLILLLLLTSLFSATATYEPPFSAAFHAAPPPAETMAVLFPLGFHDLCNATSSCNVEQTTSVPARIESSAFPTPSVTSLFSATATYEDGGATPPFSAAFHAAPPLAETYCPVTLSSGAATPPNLWRMLKIITTDLLNKLRHHSLFNQPENSHAQPESREAANHCGMCEAEGEDRGKSEDQDQPESSHEAANHCGMCEAEGEDRGKSEDQDQPESSHEAANHCGMCEAEGEDRGKSEDQDQPESSHEAANHCGMCEAEGEDRGKSEDQDQPESSHEAANHCGMCEAEGEDRGKSEDQDRRRAPSWVVVPCPDLLRDWFARVGIVVPQETIQRIGPWRIITAKPGMSPRRGIGIPLPLTLQTNHLICPRCTNYQPGNLRKLYDHYKICDGGEGGENFWDIWQSFWHKMNKVPSRCPKCRRRLYMDDVEANRHIEDCSGKRGPQK